MVWRFVTKCAAVKFATLHVEALLLWIERSQLRWFGHVTRMPQEVLARQQRWADWQIFHSESNPDPQKLNPIRSWSAKFLKIISPIQSWSANMKSCILPYEVSNHWSYFALSQKGRQNSSNSAFASRGKIDTAFWHFHNLTRKCLFGIKGKSTAGVILPLGESDWLDWSNDKDDTLGLA